MLARTSIDNRCRKSWWGRERGGGCAARLTTRCSLRPRSTLGVGRPTGISRSRRIKPCRPTNYVQCHARNLVPLLSSADANAYFRSCIMYVHRILARFASCEALCTLYRSILPLAAKAIPSKPGPSGLPGQLCCSQIRALRNSLHHCCNTIYSGARHTHCLAARFDRSGNSTCFRCHDVSDVSLASCLSLNQFPPHVNRNNFSPELRPAVSVRCHWLRVAARGRWVLTSVCCVINTIIRSLPDLECGAAARIDVTVCFRSAML